MRKQVILWLCTVLLVLVGCQSARHPVPVRPATQHLPFQTFLHRVSESESVGEAVSDKTEALIAAAEQGQPTIEDKYTVEDGILYYGGAAVTEEQKTFDFRESNLEDYSFLKDYSWVDHLLIEDDALVDLDFLRDCTSLKSLTLTCGASDFQVIGESFRNERT